MLDHPLSQRIKARSGPGGILLMQPEFIEMLRFILLETPEEINQIFRSYAKISSHFRIPSPDHLCLRLNLKILEVPPWRDYPCGFAQSEQPILRIYFLRKP
jgi:hypothetical protein